MKSPYLVKQYLTSDTDSSSFSKILWLYNPQNNVQQVGLTMFFEVVAGDLEQSLYEYVARTMWDTFVQAFHKKGYEVALQKSAFAFISVLQQLEVEELDVNFAFLAIQKGAENKTKNKVESYTMQLSVFGEMDIILLRGENYVDLFEHVPKNSTLKDLKYLEFDVEKKDVLLMSNKMLLKNTLDVGVLKFTDTKELLSSLSELEKTLSGNKKIFLLGVDVEKTVENKPKILSNQTKLTSGTLAEKLEKIQTRVKIVFDNAWQATTLKLTALAQKLQIKDKAKQFSIKLTAGVHSLMQRFRHKKSVQQDFSKDLELEGISEKEAYSKEAITTDEMGDFVDFERQEQIQSKTNVLSHPDKDYVEVTTSSGEIDITKEKEDNEPDNVSKDNVLKHLEPGAKERLFTNKNVIQDFKLRHSAKGKLVGFMQKITKGISAVAGVVFKNIAKKKNKHILTNYTEHVKKSKITIAYIIGAVLLLVVIILLFKSYKQKKAEHLKTTQFIEQQINPVSKMYEEDIKPITVSDKEHLLDLCFKNVSSGEKAITKFKNALKYEENKKNLDKELEKLHTIKDKCQSKYDKIHHIVHVKELKLIKDFSAELGSESNVSDLHVFKGLIYVVDKGKNAIYQLNPENGSVLKLEDPQGFIKSPLTIGANKNKILVCDKENGVLEYSNNKFKKIIGTSPDSIGDSCVAVAGFYENAYFSTKNGDTVYKSTGVGTGYALPTAYISNVSKILDVLIDGNVYVLRQNKDNVQLQRFFQGRYDPSFKLKGDIAGVTKGYTNPAGNFPIYLLDAKQKSIRVIEKPTTKKHPGYGIITKTYSIDDAKIKTISAFVVDLSLRSNKERNLYLLSDGVLWKMSLTN